ncbi:meiosis inhibitor protein 1 isoform X4 [Pangasianodon hypophthalmus]|uniref:meiosis inhibitor protein 1 isoform X4 n=1 Tax=Pangasianodon hypophthalmus TaxID=310915 RepID=UPI0023073E06|nr:meiosis inhibitor protein 1 isoform X4 [Pangasianodon hypophthalmus]
MAAVDIDVVYEKIHHRHDPRWCARAGPGRDVGAGARASVRVCVACVIELIDSQEVSAVRKAVALAGVGELLKTEGVMREILQQDDRVCVHFTSSLLKMLQCVEDPSTLDRVMQVLVQLLLDLKVEQLVQHVMNELQTQLCDVKWLVVCVMFLGKLLDAVPAVGHMLSTSHLCVLESVCARMVSADEELKAAVCYVFRGVWESELALHSLPHTLRDRVCVFLLHTLTHACSHQLIINCLGLLLLMLRSGETVCILMNQGEETQHPELQHSSLPLILKRLLLSGDESLQVASVQCVCAVLNHSTQYCTSFIHDDIPEFLFERLSSSNDVLLWCVYSCVLLLCEDSLFFSQCHSVYGIESLVRSLKASLKLSNVEVPKQGLQLLTVILEKQPAGVRLFPIGPAFVGVAEVVIGGVASPCLRVATQAARAATALMKMHHQSTPVHYGELKKIMEALSCRFTELPSRAISQRRRCFADSESSSQSAKAGAFFMQALVCFHEACRLVEECVCEANVKESPLTAADQQNEDTLESVCVCLLKCCDTAYIPTVTRVCERIPSPRVLQLFLSILSVQFSLSPSLMPAFANKLASSGFIRLTLENKALLCSGNRHTSLNIACCGFLLKLCMCLLSQPDLETHSQHLGVEEVECVLRECLPSLYYHVCDWPSVLSEVPVANQNTRYCLLHLLYLSLIHGDRLLPDATVFSSVVEFNSAVVEQCDTLPPSVLQSVLYLLSETQESSSDLDWPSLKSIIKFLSSTPPSSSPLSVPHPSLLRFIFRYPELAERFGTTVLIGWLKRGKGGKDLDPEQTVLMELLEKNPSVLLTMLGVVFEEEEEVAECAVSVIKRFLTVQQNCSSVSPSLLKTSLLQVLPKLNWDSSTVVRGVCLMLEVLCVVQTNSTVHTDMDHTDFKLLYHISNLVGKMKCSNTEYLLPALNYLYCCLALSPTHTADRVVSMLLCNTGLMELLQTLLDLSQSSSSSSSSPSSPSSPVICCSLLLLSSLITLQHTHSAQVHKSVCLELESVVRTLMFWKRHTDSLLLGCTVRLLQAVLDVDLCSPVVCVSECVELHPLSYRGAISFTTALQSLLLQKQEMLLSASVNCLNSLIRFLNRGRPAIVQHVVCQPWNRFLLYSLLNSGEYLTLHPATLRLLTLLVRWSGDGVQWESDVVCVCETAERRGVKELRGNTIHTLKRLLIEARLSRALSPPGGVSVRCLSWFLWFQRNSSSTPRPSSIS